MDNIIQKISSTILAYLNLSMRFYTVFLTNTPCFVSSFPCRSTLSACLHKNNKQRISKKFVSYVFSPSVNELQHNWHYVINAVRILQFKSAILSLAAKLNLKINAESQVFSKFALKRLICATCFWQYPVKIILCFVELLVV